MTDECLIRIEIGGELIISAEIPLEDGKSGAIIGKNDLQGPEKAAICRGLSHMANFVDCEELEHG